ncbi:MULTISPECIES: sensor histidine kinase [Roseivirga]|uniref:sensor histidine kinase n=1 Tax=Roseivirga TaxID=290180 RepID=UPI001B289EB6|nr:MULTISPECIES: histidine kinase [Roseivirga]MBO6661220.1 histidine kinase [Roseivirga sp.]MBO6908796.1 histidine kinase [Roseivirga sp.]WPZ11696.1 histidine kinase [Roseivirga spongicola]
MNKHFIRTAFVTVTIIFFVLGIQNTFSFYGYLQNIELPDGWSKELLWNLQAFSKIALLSILISLIALGYRINKYCFVKQNLGYGLLIYIGISGLLAALGMKLVSLVPYDFFTISNLRPDWPMIDSRVFWSLFHLFILSFFLSGTVFHVEKIELNSFFNKKAKSLPSNFWITVFLIFLTLFISILILITQGEMSSRWIATWSFSNIIYCVIGSSFCLIVFLFFLNTFHGDLSIRFIDKTILFLTSSIGLFGYAFLVYSISISFDFTQLGGYQQIVSFWSMSLIFILGVIFLYYLFKKLNIFSFSELISIHSTQAELSQLKSQINPHFLFNSLNSLYGLALEESSPKTSTGIQKLSEMMRFMLRENVEDKIEISREFEYVENYIELQKLRVDGNEKVRLEYEIDTACEGKITPMLIIPFIENAFKHGVSAHHNSWIEIKLNCNKEAIHLNVKNSNHKKSKSTEEESGIGLENVRQRLTMLYPGKHLFQLFENEESFEANLKIELN